MKALQNKNKVLEAVLLEKDDVIERQKVTFANLRKRVSAEWPECEKS